MFQPAPFGAGVTAPQVRLGGVASRLIITGTELVPPALVAVQVKVVPAVSAVTLWGRAGVYVVEVMGDSSSVTVHVTSTSLVYHPLLPRVPVILGVITGGVVSDGVGTDTFTR